MFIKLFFVNMLRCILWGMALLLCGGQPVAQTLILDESFDSGIGVMIPTSDGVGAEWSFANACPSSISGGHSTTGTARWGQSGDCTHYG